MTERTPQAGRTFRGPRAQNISWAQCFSTGPRLAPRVPPRVETSPTREPRQLSVWLAAAPAVRRPSSCVLRAVRPHPFPFLSSRAERFFRSGIPRRSEDRRQHHRSGYTQWYSVDTSHGVPELRQQADCTAPLFRIPFLAFPGSRLSDRRPRHSSRVYRGAQGQRCRTSLVDCFHESSKYSCFRSSVDQECRDEWRSRRRRPSRCSFVSQRC